MVAGRAAISSRLLVVAAALVAVATCPARAAVAPAPACLRPGVAAPAGPGGTDLVILTSGGEVRAGAKIEICWGAVPAQFEEMELVLSLDDGRHFNVRISPEIDPGLGRFTWRVPNLPAERARVSLRVGRQGEERVQAVSRSFRILGDASLPRERIGLSEGYVWDGIRQDAPPPLVGIGSPKANLEAAGGRPSCEIPPRGPALAHQTTERLTTRNTAPRAPTAQTAEAHAPSRFAPLRN